MNGKEVIEFLKVANLTKEQVAKMIAFSTIQDSHGYFSHYLPYNVKQYLLKVLGDMKTK